MSRSQIRGCMITATRTKVWFKIHEDGKRADGSWGSDEFITAGKAFNITISRSLKVGNYIVRYVGSNDKAS